jgi:hypothetical protein
LLCSVWGALRANLLAVTAAVAASTTVESATAAIGATATTAIAATCVRMSVAAMVSIAVTVVTAATTVVVSAAPTAAVVAVTIIAVAPAPAVPGADANKHAVHEPIRSVVAIGRAGIRIIVIISIGTDRGWSVHWAADADSNTDANLGVGAPRAEEKQHPQQRDIF